MTLDTNTIFHGDNLQVLRHIDDDTTALIYIDPPFNTKKTQRLKSLKNVNTNQKSVVSDMSYEDSFDDLCKFLEPRLIEAKRVLTSSGSIFMHLDWREVHYVKVLMDTIFGRNNFMNEIIWSYDYGARQKDKWPTKHDSILWYVMDTDNYTFNYEVMERIPYMAPGLVGPEKAARGKTLTDVWWHTIVPTAGKERLGYPTQKPLGILKRIVNIHSKPGDIVLDFFAGSGTTGDAANALGRRFILADRNPQAIETMKKRFAGISVNWIDLNQDGTVAAKTSSGFFE